MMKKTTTFFLSICLGLSLAACGGSKKDDPEPNNTQSSGNGETPRTVAPGVIKPVDQTSPSRVTVTRNEPAPLTGITAIHNAWRKRGKLPPLNWNNSIAAAAQARADNLKNNGCVIPSEAADSQYGENLTITRSQRSLIAAQVVTKWSNEGFSYNHETDTCAPKNCVRYKQLMWRDTKELGCGYARCDDKKTDVWVCLYNPAGNVEGQKPY